MSMTIKEFERNKIRYFDSIRKEKPLPKYLGEGICNIGCCYCMFYDHHKCLIRTNLPLAEQKLQAWLDKHKIVTNRDKFKEVFGAEALDHTWSGVCSQICPKICPDCTSCEYSFWNKEYHEPNAGESEVKA